MANPIHPDTKVLEAFRLLRSNASLILNPESRENRKAELVLMESFLNDIHEIAKMAKRAQGLDR